MRQRLFTGEVAEGCQVVANASPNMDVRVPAGTFRIPTGTAPSNYWYEAGIDTASPGEAVTISTANPSNPRRDFIVAYIDTAVTPSTGVTNNSNSMLKLAAVAGTPAASPSDPSAGQITTAIGASNPYIILARVRVGTGVTQITNSDIDDLRSMIVINTANIAVGAVTRAKLAFSGAKVKRTAVQAIGNAVGSTIVWTAEDYDTNTYHDNSTNPSRLTFDTTGYATLGVMVSFTSWVAGSRLIINLKKGGAVFRELYDNVVSSVSEPSFTFSIDEDVTTGDYFEIEVYQATGGTINLSTDSRAWIRFNGV